MSGDVRITTKSGLTPAEFHESRCAICLENWDADHPQLAVLKCHHVFCQTCIEKLANMPNACCGTCRAPLKDRVEPIGINNGPSIQEVGGLFIQNQRTEAAHRAAIAQDLEIAWVMLGIPENYHNVREDHLYE